MAAALLLMMALSSSTDWPGFRGPSQTAAVEGSGVFDGVAEPGLQVAWTAAAGSGYSGVTVVAGRAFTAFAAGADDVVAAFDAATGRELWRAPLGEMHHGHDGSHDGPIATPAADAERVFALGPRGRLLALDARTGAIRWSQDLAKATDAVAPHYGWSTSPLLAGDCVVVQHAIKDRQSVACFDRKTGRALWSAGKNAVGYQSPVLARLGGQEQILAADAKSLYGLDPKTGGVLWEHAHGGDDSAMGTESLVPLAIDGDRVLIMPKVDSAVLLHVTSEAGAWKVETVWSGKGFRNSYSRPVYHKGFFYGYAGAFLACVDAATGETRWRSRAPGDGFLALVDGRLVVQTKTGSVHVAEASPEAYRELAEVQAFPEDHSWTAPSAAGGRLFVRGMSKVSALRVVDARGAGAVAGGTDLPLGPRMTRLLSDVHQASDKTAAVDAFLASVDSFPLVEDDVVEFLYRGKGADVGIMGDLIGARAQRAMRRVEDTDLFYWSGRVRPKARLNYRFVRDLDENVPDPRNPRREPGRGGEMSWFAMPGWQRPAFLVPTPEGRKGRIEVAEVESAVLKTRRRIDVYLPRSYDAGSDRLPTVYVTGGKEAIEDGRLVDVLDSLVEGGAPAMVVVFLHPLPDPPPNAEPDEKLAEKQSASLAEEVVPFVDGKYRTRPDRRFRGVFGAGGGGLEALDAAIRQPATFGRLSVQSALMVDLHVDELRRVAEKAALAPDAASFEWSSYDLRAEHEGWNMAAYNRTVADLLKSRGVPVAVRQVEEGASWGSWRNRADLVFGRMFE
jgi:enterochelin esterase-like enzyme/outer membrane protein assembly factor BamB